MTGYRKIIRQNRLGRRRGRIIFSVSLAVVLATLCYSAAPYLSPDGINSSAFYGLFRLNGGVGVEGELLSFVSKDGDIPFAVTLYDSLAKESEKSSKGYRIVKLDLSKDRSLSLSNRTSLDPDLDALLSAPYPIEHAEAVKMSAEDSPLVLVLHTHGTECYSPDGAESYDEKTSFRSSDTSQNVVAVGAALTESLLGAGIPTIHCETMHDLDSYNDAYDYESRTIQSYLKKYPSIKYVFDIHRDAIIQSDGTMVATEATLDGEAAAQVMAVVGTDEAGADHPLWQNNLNVAVKLQNLLSEKYPGLARPINLRSASFNEQYATGSMILEIGSCGNSLAEALRSAKALGEVIAELILQN